MSDEVCCVICGEFVSKRKTLAYERGRACRTHSEVQKMVKDVKNAETKAVEEAKRKVEDKERDDFVKASLALLREWLESHCWRCGGEGFSRQVFGARMLIAMEKLRIKGKPVPLFFEGHEALLDETGLKGKRALAFFPSWDVERVQEEAELAVRVTGNVCLCSECAERTGRTDFTDRFMPKMNPDDMSKAIQLGMAVNAVVHPVVEEMAVNEIREEAKLN